MRTRSFRFRRSAAGLAWVGSIGLAAAGCSSGHPVAAVASLGHGNTAPASGPLTAARSDQLFVEFARCLRAHGVDEPDPVHRPGHTGLSVEIPKPGPTTNVALDACNHFITPVVQAKQAHASQQLTAWLPGLTHYAECMRTHQIAMLDPGSMGELNLGSVPGIDNDFGRYTPQFRAADSACRHLLPSGVHDDGTGP